MHRWIHWWSIRKRTHSLVTARALSTIRCMTLSQKSDLFFFWEKYKFLTKNNLIRWFNRPNFPGKRQRENSYPPEKTHNFARIEISRCLEKLTKSRSRFIPKSEKENTETHNSRDSRIKNPKRKKKIGENQSKINKIGRIQIK